MINATVIAEKIFKASVESVLPGRLISNAMSVKESNLLIGSLKYPLKPGNNIYVVGAGKASAMMASEVEKILGSRITGGVVVVKYGHSSKLKFIKSIEAGHPVPDSNGYEATRSILQIAEKAVQDDLVICLISGGGSALLADFPEGSSPEEMALVNDLLIKSGASINEINTVRKHLSMVKGGQLARSFYPATIISLILSDIIGDPLDAIASGPTAPDPTTYKQALDILEKYKLVRSVPEGIISCLRNGEKGFRPETPKPGDKVFNRTFNMIIGNNRLALEAGRKYAEKQNLNIFVADDSLQGDIAGVAKYIVGESLKFKNDINVAKPACLLFGGEPTVKVTGNGMGGRNQQLALMCSLLIQNESGITILAAGTDGTDGPTDAAGAVVDNRTVIKALNRKIDPIVFLQDFNSYNFFRICGGHIITGPTLTNVMDIVVVIVQ